MKSHAAKSATARRTVARTAGTAIRKDMDSFVKRSMSSAKQRKEEAQTGLGWTDGAAVARAVLEWKPKAPPGRLVVHVELGHVLEPALPAGHDGGRALFAGRTFKIYNAIHPKEGAER